MSHMLQKPKQVVQVTYDRNTQSLKTRASTLVNILGAMRWTAKTAGPQIESDGLPLQTAGIAVEVVIMRCLDKNS